MAKHKLRINVTDDAPDDSLVSARTVSLRERFLTRILGRRQRVTVLVPGRQVGSVEIIEPDDDLMALANALNGRTGGEGR